MKECTSPAPLYQIKIRLRASCDENDRLGFNLENNVLFIQSECVVIDSATATSNVGSVSVKLNYRHFCVSSGSLAEVILKIVKSCFLEATYK